MNFKTKQKNWIRENVWSPAFEDMIQKEAVAEDDLRYFELPGPECLHLKQLLAVYNFQPNNICLAEKKHIYIPVIQIITKGDIPLLKGDIDRIFNSPEIENRFPFHIINLDFCGMIFAFPKTQNGKYQKRWNVVFRTIELNKKLDSYYILLTVTAQRNNEGGMETVNRIWDRFTKETNLKNKNKYKDSIKIAVAVPYIILNKAVTNDYTFNFDEFGVWLYSQEGSPYTMVTFRLKLIKTNIRFGDDVTYLQDQITKLSTALISGKIIAI